MIETSENGSVRAANKEELQFSIGLTGLRTYLSSDNFSSGYRNQEYQ